MRLSFKAHTGFALIQIIITIIIVSILFLVLLLSLNPSRSLIKSRDSQREADLKNFKNALDAYMNSNSRPQYVPGFNPTLPSPPFIPLDQISNCEATINCCTVKNVKHSGWLAPVDPNNPTDCPNGPNYPSWAVDLSQYISKIPLDPTNNATYHYRYQSNNEGDKYSFTAKYESEHSPTHCFQTGTFIPESFCWGP